MKVAAGLLVVAFLAWMVAALQTVIFLLLTSMVLAIGLQPAISWLERRGIPRGLAVTVLFLTGIVVVGAFLALVVPVIVREISDLVQAAPGYLRRAQHGSGLLGRLDRQFDLISRLQNLSKRLPTTALSLAKGVVSLLFGTLTILILTAYFATAMPRMRRGVARLLRRDHREDFLFVLEESTSRIGGYVMGNMAISVIAGVVAFLGLAFLGIPYAAALAFWVAITDLIPTVGAVLGASVAVLVAAFVGIPQLVVTLLLFIVYQQVENYLIAPRVMKRAIDVSPPAVIVAVLVGGTLGGFIGALLALPVAAVIKIVLQEMYLVSRIEEVRRADATEGRRRRRPWRRRAREVAVAVEEESRAAVGGGS
jgi:predicted PurR-regulated permease PerM